MKTPVWNQVFVSAGGTFHDVSSLVAASGSAALGKDSKILRIQLLDPAEATELALDCVEIAVMIRFRETNRLRLMESRVSTRFTTWTGKGSRVIQGCPAASSAR